MQIHQPLVVSVTFSSVKMADAGMVSGEFVKAFLTYMSLYPIGSLVLLSNQCIAKVVDSNEDSADKPIVSILLDSAGRFFVNDEIVQKNLKYEPDLKIVQALSINKYKNISIMDGF